jgi:hypothetical protein
VVSSLWLDPVRPQAERYNVTLLNRGEQMQLMETP